MAKTTTAAAYIQLQPVDYGLGDVALAASKMYADERAKEDAAIAKKQEEMKAYLDDIASYESKWEPQEVEYAFRDKMIKLETKAQDELYDINKRKKALTLAGMVNSNEYKKLTLKEQNLLRIPSTLKGTFDSYNNAWTDYNENVGKKGGYDRLLNIDKMSIIQQTLMGNKWDVDYDDKGNLKFNGSYQLRNPENINEKQARSFSLSPGEFAKGPSAFGPMRQFVDIQQVVNDEAGLIGTETNSIRVYDPATNEYVEKTIKDLKGANNRTGRMQMLKYLTDKLNKNQDLVDYMHASNSSINDLAANIMQSAQIKSDDVEKILRYAGPKETEGTGKVKGWDAVTVVPETEEKAVFFGGEDGAEQNVFVNKGYNQVAVSGDGRDINPRRMIIMNTGSTGFAFQYGIQDDDEIEAKDQVVNARMLQETPYAVKDFKLQGIISHNIYRGAGQYELTYTDENERPRRMILKKGMIIPNNFLDAENLQVEVVNPGKDNLAITDPDGLQETKQSILNNTEYVRLMVGESKLGDKDAIVGIPMGDSEGIDNIINQSTIEKSQWSGTKGGIQAYIENLGDDTTGAIVPKTINYGKPESKLIEEIITERDDEGAPKEEEKEDQQSPTGSTIVGKSSKEIKDMFEKSGQSISDEVAKLLADQKTAEDIDELLN